MLDPFSYTSPSRVKTLLVPVNDIAERDFLSATDTLRSSTEVRLVDVTPISNQFFNPQGFPSGRVIYDFQLSNNNNETLFLHDFEPFRKIFVTIGILNYNESLNEEFLSSQLQTLEKVYNSSIFQCLVIFNSPISKIQQNNVTNKNYFYLSNDRKHLTNIDTIMCDITKKFLEALAIYSSSYQNITLRSPGLMINNNITRTISQTQKRLSSNSNLSVSLDSKNDRRHAKAKGRQAKILGNFYLLAGRYPDALREFGDATTLLRPSGDYLWLGSALEGIGICIVLLSFLGVPYQMPPILSSVIQTSNSSVTLNNSNINGNTVKSSFGSPTNSPRNSMTMMSTLKNASEINALPIPELINQLTLKILLYYGLSTNDFEDFVPDMVYCETILRFVKFMTAIHIGGGFIPSVLHNIVRGQSLEKKINDTFFTKNDILKFSSKIFTLQLKNMNIISQCQVYCTLAAIYGDICLYRKRGFILRTLFISLIPNLTKDSRTKVNDDHEIDNVIREANKNKLFDENIQELLESLILIYGISNEPESNINDANKTPWFKLHKSVLYLCIQLCESIENFHNVIKFVSILLTRYLQCLSTKEQNDLYIKMKKLIQNSSTSNLGLKFYYWDPYIIRDIKLLKPANNLSPSKDVKGKSRANTVSNGPDDPLIFNPYEPYVNSSKSASSGVVLVQDEIVELSIKLQNPFAFEIDISEIEIVNEGEIIIETMLSLNESILVQPETSIDVIIPIKPTSTGDLKISGAILKVCDCDKLFFKICREEKFEQFEKIKKTGVSYNIENLVNNQNVRQLTNNREAVNNSIKKPKKPTKSSVLENSLENLSLNRIEGRIVTKELQLMVIPPQPILSLMDLTINNGWIMLLEGERLNFSLILKNLSNVAINYLSFAFWDSTIEPLTQALNSKDIPPNEIYEIEFFLLKKKPLKILNKSDLKLIKSTEDFKINFEIVGKRGMKESTIILEYCNKNETYSNNLNNFFLRKLTIPINVTVNPCVELLECDIIPLFLTTKELENLYKSFKEQIWSFLKNRSAEYDESISDYCLLILDFKNSWNEKVTINFKNSEIGFEINDSMTSFSTQRYFIPMKRIKFTEDDLAKPIPSLRNKQYIHNYKLTVEESTFIRESFWYREKILDNIQATWEDKVNLKTGDIELRGIRLSTKMVNILKMDKIFIDIKLFDQTTGEEVSKNGLNYKLACEVFYTIKTSVKNNSNRPIGSGILRFLPIQINSINNVSIDRKFLISGLLQNHLPIELNPGDCWNSNLSFTILNKGDYELGCLFEYDEFSIIPREPIYLSAD